MADRQEIELAQLLKALVERNASDLDLTAGHPPVLRIGGHMERLASRPLEESDCVRLMQSITPKSQQNELEEKGGTHFGFAFGDQARFHVAVFKQYRKLGLVFRRLSIDGKHPT